MLNNIEFEYLNYLKKKKKSELILGDDFFFIEKKKKIPNDVASNLLLGTSAWSN